MVSLKAKYDYNIQYMLQIGTHRLNYFGVILTGQSNFSRVLLINCHRSEIIRRRKSSKGRWH